ncbi:MAG TPA: SRPBCC family protein [Phenylobacterium sp.]
MASIRREITLSVPADRAWDAVADFGQVHRRLAPGFVTDATLEGHVRTVTFTSGQVFREHLVACEHERRRLVYAIAEAPFLSYQGTVEVRPEGSGSRFVWVVDLLPNELAGRVGVAMDAGARAMQAALEQTERA